MGTKYLKFIVIVISGLAMLPAIWVLMNSSTSTTLQSSIALLIIETLFVAVFLLNGAVSLEKGDKKVGWLLFCTAVFLIVIIIASFLRISVRIGSMLP